MTTPVGQFKVAGGKLIVTDPCYKADTWCNGIIKNVKNGVWNGYINVQDFGAGGLGGRRVTALWAECEGAGMGGPFTLQDIDVGVDSGQAGIFSMKSYPPNGGSHDGGDEEFYDKCCNLTLSPSAAGVIDFGVVSSSGFGDGGYACYVSKGVAGAYKGKVVAVKIVFIDEENETCSECGEPRDDLRDGMCSECYEEIVERCDGCRTDFAPDELIDGMCPDCREEAQDER